MTPRYSLKHPGSILWTSIFHDFRWFWRNVPVLQRFPFTSRNETWTIGKSVKNHWGSNLGFLNWCGSAKVMVYQRAPAHRLEEPPLSQSGAPCWPGGECFAPLYELSCFNGSSRALRVMCEVYCASARPQIMKIPIFHQNVGKSKIFKFRRNNVGASRNDLGHI